MCWETMLEVGGGVPERAGAESPRFTLGNSVGQGGHPLQQVLYGGMRRHGQGLPFVDVVPIRPAASTVSTGRRAQRPQVSGRASRGAHETATHLGRGGGDCRAIPIADLMEVAAGSNNPQSQRVGERLGPLLRAKVRVGGRPALQGPSEMRPGGFTAAPIGKELGVAVVEAWIGRI